MRNLESKLIELDVAKEQNVKIEGTGTIGKPSGPIPAELLLDSKQPIQQLPRFEFRFKGNHGVHETRLLGEAHGLGAVEPGPLRNAAQRFEARDGRRQRRLRPAGPTGQVCAHSDVGRAHVS